MLCDWVSCFHRTMTSANLIGDENKGIIITVRLKCMNVRNDSLFWHINKQVTKLS